MGFCGHGVAMGSYLGSRIGAMIASDEALLHRLQEFRSKRGIFLSWPTPVSAIRWMVVSGPRRALVRGKPASSARSCTGSRQKGDASPLRTEARNGIMSLDQQHSLFGGWCLKKKAERRYEGSGRPVRRSEKSRGAMR